MRHARYVDESAISAGEVKANDTVYAGVATGLLAGAAMLVFAMISVALEEISPVRPLELAGATFFGSEDTDGGAHVALLGAALWAVVSAGLGLVFAAMIPRDYPWVSAAILGVGYAFVVLALMSSLVLPSVNPSMRAGMTETGGAWVLAYVVFGLLLGFVPAFRQRLLARARHRH